MSSHSVEDKLMDDRLLSDELKEDLTHIFNLLLSNGADIHEVTF